MTELLDKAVATARSLPPDVQDEIARMVLALAGDDRDGHHLTPEEAAGQNVANAEEARGDYATDEEVRAGWAKHGLCKAASVRVRRALDFDTQRAVKAFLDRLDGKHSPIDILVYGSRARGDHEPDSDADIAVILKGQSGDRYEVLRDLSDAAYDVMLETGIHIQPLPLWEAEMERPELFGNPVLIEIIKREGLRP